MNPAMTHWDAGAKASTPRASVEKPPVGSVENAWAIASNRFIWSSIPVQPKALRISTIATVSAT